VQLADKHAAILCSISCDAIEGQSRGLGGSANSRGLDANAASCGVLAAEVKGIALDHLAVLMDACAYIAQVDDELCRDFLCFVADAPESMLMVALRDVPDPSWHQGSLRILDSALRLFTAYVSACTICTSASQSATPAQTPQRTPHGHYVTQLYSHMVVARHSALRYPICSRACVLYAQCLCQLLTLDGGASAGVLDGLNAMHYIIQSVGAAAKHQVEGRQPSKGIAMAPAAAGVSVCRA
jgi:hypothetical protein